MIVAIRSEETPSGKIVRRDEASGEIRGTVSREGKDDIPTPSEPNKARGETAKTPENYTLRLSPVETINLIKSHSLSTDSLKAFARSKDLGVRMAILDSPKVTQEILDYLVSSSKKEEYRLRLTVARRYDLSTLTMARLASDSIPAVRAQMARHLNLNEGSQNDLSYDPDPLVRANLASNKKANAKVLERLAQDREPNVQIAVAGNEETSPDILFSMQVVYGHTSLTLITAIAGNPNASMNTLETLSQYSDVSVRAAVAFNVSTPDEVLDALSKDTSAESLPVMRALVANPRLPKDALHNLLKVSDPKIQEHIALHRNSDSAILDSLTSVAENEYIIELLCERPNISVETLKKLVEDKSIRPFIRNRANKHLEYRLYGESN